MAGRAALIEETFRLIRLRSDSDVTAVMDYLERRLPFLPWRRVAIDETATQRPLYNLVALTPKASLVINTHLDTVPAMDMPQAFEPRLHNGRIYGRGAVDTKGLLAACIIALERFHKTFPECEVPVSLAFTPDEERYQALGSQHLANLLAPRQPVLILEPTHGRICTQQLGTLEFRVKVRATSFHAGESHRSPNAIRLLAQWLLDIEPHLPQPLRIFQFSGGSELYATPPSAELLAELPLGPKDHPQALRTLLEKSLQHLSHSGHATLEVLDHDPYLDFGRHPGVLWLEQAYRHTFQQAPSYGVMPAWTDAANLAQKGIPCVIFGFGDLGVAHTSREHITVDDLERNAQLLYNLLTILTQGPH